MNMVKYFLTLLFLFQFGVLKVNAFNGADYYTAKNWDIGVTAGGFFPFGIVGVRDQYKAWSIFLSQPGRIFSSYDYNLYFLNHKEVSFYTASVGGRINFVLYEALRGYFKLALNYNYYKRKPSQVREFNFVGIVGSSVGFGTVHKIGQGNSFISEFKYNMGPGNSLYVGVGFTHEFGDESSDGSGGSGN